MHFQTNIISFEDIAIKVSHNSDADPHITVRNKKSAFKFDTLIYEAMLTLVMFLFTNHSKLSAQTSPHQSNPSITCQLLDAQLLTGTGTSDDSFKVSSGSLLRLRITIDGLSSSLSNPEEKISVNPSNPDSESTYFTFCATKNFDDSIVSTRIIETMQRISGGKLIKTLFFEISGDPEVRKSRIAAAWDKVETKAKKLSANNDFNSTNTANESIVRTLNSEMIDNEPGEFVIICSFVSNRNKTWNGKITSLPLKVLVPQGGTLQNPKE